MIKENIKEYLNSIANPEKMKYIIDIFSHFDKGGKFVAYHGSCTDGAITAALLNYVDNEINFFPLDYNILKDTVLRPILTEQKWYAILDLEPFNSFTLELYIDHHRSVIGSSINSNRIHFEVGKFGPSAAFVLLNALIGQFQIPEYLKELVKISEVTDTASFAIDPPLDSITLEDQSFLDDFNNLCWFVQDATNIEDDFTFQRNNDIVHGLSKFGVTYLLSESFVANVNKQREKRKLANKFLESLTPTNLMVIINAPDNTFRQFIALKLGKKKTKVIVFFNQREIAVTISLRQSKKNSKEEIEFYRLDIFAKKFSSSGGGHAEASGSVSESMDSAIKIAKDWAKEKDLKLSIIEYSN
jgi:hypothetical protein